MSVFEPYPMRDTIQHFCEKHLDKIKAYMDKVSIRIPSPAKCTIEEKRQKKSAKLHFACQGGGQHCLYSKTYFTMRTRNPRIWIHLMFISLQVGKKENICRNTCSNFILPGSAHARLELPRHPSRQPETLLGHVKMRKQIVSNSRDERFPVPQRPRHSHQRTATFRVFRRLPNMPPECWRVGGPTGRRLLQVGLLPLRPPRKSRRLPQR
jgi:hypothetical protein